MKGKIIKSKHKTVSPLGNQVGSTVEWEVEYQEKLPHAGVSKKGTGPGVGKDFYKTKLIPLHPDFYNIAEENKEVEFEIDPMTPVGYAMGKGSNIGIVQKLYGEGARILSSRNINKKVEDITVMGKSWIFRKLCRHKFFSHRIDHEYICMTCDRCGQQYKIKS